MHEAIQLAQSVHSELGTVLHCPPAGDAADAIVVTTASGRFEARRAASCLLAPEMGDSVLVAVPSKGAIYVLAVLERRGAQKSRIVLGDDAEIAANQRLTLRAGEQLDLATGGRARVAADAFELHAAKATVAVGEVSLMSRALSLYAGVARGVLDRLEAHVEQISVRAKNAHRSVEGLDLTEAGTFEVRAEHNVHVRGENAFVTAEELVKLDGDLIHLG